MCSSINRNNTSRTFYWQLFNNIFLHVDRTFERSSITNAHESCSRSHRPPGVEYLDSILGWRSTVFGQESSGGLLLSTQVSGLEEKEETIPLARESPRHRFIFCLYPRFWQSPECMTPTVCMAWCPPLSTSLGEWRDGWNAPACPLGGLPPAASRWSPGARCGPLGRRSGTFTRLSVQGWVGT